jgi:hypothetical protein
MAVFKPEKLKFKPGTLGLVNANASFPIEHACQLKDHQDRKT